MSDAAALRARPGKRQIRGDLGARPGIVCAGRIIITIKTAGYAVIGADETTLSRETASPHACAGRSRDRACGTFPFSFLLFNSLLREMTTTVRCEVDPYKATSKAEPATPRCHRSHLLSLSIARVRPREQRQQYQTPLSRAVDARALDPTV